MGGWGRLAQGLCCCSPTPAPSISVCPIVSGCTTFSSSDGRHFSSGLKSLRALAAMDTVDIMSLWVFYELLPTHAENIVQLQ